LPSCASALIDSATLSFSLTQRAMQLRNQRLEFEAAINARDASRTPRRSDAGTSISGLTSAPSARGWCWSTPSSSAPCSRWAKQRTPASKPNERQNAPSWSGCEWPLKLPTHVRIEPQPDPARQPSGIPAPVRKDAYHAQPQVGARDKKDAIFGADIGGSR